jgi:hypothetical protein
MHMTTKSGVLELKSEDVILYTREVLIPQCNMRPTLELLFEAIQIHSQF